MCGDPVNAKVYTKYFKAFGDPTRLKILGLLADKEMSVNERTEKIGLSQPTISRHLAILREAEIVVDRRNGQQVFYKLNLDSVKNCCHGFCDCLEVQVKVKKGKKVKK